MIFLKERGESMRNNLQEIVEIMRELKEIPNTKHLEDETLQSLAIELVKIKAIKDIGIVVESAIKEND